MQAYSDTILDRQGNVVTGATITVTDYPSGTTSTTYATNAIGSNSNPITSDPSGQFTFYAKDGSYTVTVSKSGVTSAAKVITLKDTSAPANVKGYGAAGDGVTTDTTAIAAAATAVGITGGVLNFPGGTYLGSLPSSYPLVVLEYDGPKTPVNVYQESGETTRFAKRVFRGQNAGSHTGEESSLFVVEHHPVGSGTNGITHSDTALTVVAQKKSFDTTIVVGEVDGVSVVVRNGGAGSDSAGYLANVATYGTGFMAAFESSTSIISGAVTQKIQSQVGVCDNVNNLYIGHYALASVGALTNAFRADTAGAATWDYLFRGYQNAVEKFSVTGIGKVNFFDSSGNKKSLVCESNTLNVYANDGTTVLFQLNNSGNVSTAGSISGGQAGFGGAGVSATTVLNLLAGTTALSSLRIPHGAAPTAPVNGDMWTTTAGLFVRINGATVGPLT